VFCDAVQKDHRRTFEVPGGFAIGSS